MSINGKFGVIVGIPIVAVVALVVVGAWTLSGTQSGIQEVVDHQFMALIDEDIDPLLNQEMLPLINEEMVRLRHLDNSLQLMLEADRDMHQALIAERVALVAKTDDTFADADKTNEENIGQAERRVRNASEFFTTDETKALYAQFEQAFAQWKQETRKVVQGARDPGQRAALEASSNGGAAAQAFDRSRNMLDELQGLQTQQIEVTLARIDAAKGRIDEKYKQMGARKDAVVAVTGQIQSSARTSLVWFMCIGGAVVLLVPVVGVMVARSITRPIQRIIASLSEGAAQVSDAAHQVSASSGQVAADTSEQASSLEETTGALVEMAAMTQRNAEAAREANTLAEAARGNADRGDQTMAQLNSAMTAINESSGQIRNIIRVIEEIAFQTNLLALNAAVEAARAGEHGKGFAVVADEVRSLAVRAAGAAQETTTLIEESVNRAKGGSEICTGATDALHAIVGDIAKVADLLSGIARASEEQSEGVEQINSAVAQIDGVTQRNAAGAEESAAAAQQLTAQAQAVHGTVAELKALADGGKRKPSGTTPGGDSKPAAFPTKSKAAGKLTTSKPVAAAGGKATPAKAKTSSPSSQPVSSADDFLSMDDSTDDLATF